MRESKIEQYLVTRCNAAGILQRKLEYIGRNGAPDRLLIKDGKVTFCELKTLKGKVLPLQRLEHVLLRQHMAKVYVVRSIEEVDEMLRIEYEAGK